MTSKTPGVVFGAALLMSGFAGGCTSNAAKISDMIGGDGSAGDDTSAGPSHASLVASNGYITAAPWAGYGFTATDPGAATITPNCAGATGCTPPFVGTDFCMTGKVTGRPDYTGFAMLGWNVNQQAAQGATMDTWAVPASGSVTVTVTDDPSSVALRLQLQGTDPHSGADRWCVPLESGKPIAWSDFTTNCWTTGGSPLTPGTMIQQGAVIVPGLLTDLPFNVCLIDIQIQE
jgi:hypothetical protein